MRDVRFLCVGVGKRADRAGDGRGLSFAEGAVYISWLTE